MNDKEINDIVMLSELGFTSAEIASLQQLQRAYAQQKFSTPADSDAKHTIKQHVEAAKQAIYGMSYPEWTLYQ